MLNAITKCGKLVLAKSRYYVPKDTKALLMSSRMEIQKNGDRDYTILVTYGQGISQNIVAPGRRNPANYVVYVHEDLTKAHDAPTSAKFLERGYEETKSERDKVMKDFLLEIASGRSIESYDAQGNSVGYEYLS